MGADDPAAKGGAPPAPRSKQARSGFANGCMFLAGVVLLFVIDQRGVQVGEGGPRLVAHYGATAPDTHGRHGSRDEWGGALRRGESLARPEERVPLESEHRHVPDSASDHVDVPRFRADRAVSFNVILTSAGRPTLAATLESAAVQLTEADFITVISDDPYWHEYVGTVLASVPCNCTKLFIANARPLGWWGHGSRNRWQKTLPGAYHLNADDDDLYTPDAFRIIRSIITDLEPRVYIFRMLRNHYGSLGFIPPLGLTKGEEMHFMTVSTQCGVYRAVPHLLPAWNERYGGDGDYFEALCRNFGYENVTVVPKVIYMLGQGENLYGHIKNMGIDQDAPWVPPHKRPKEPAGAAA